MLGRPAIQPHTGLVAPPLVAARHAGLGETTAMAPIRPVGAVDGVLPSLEELARAGVDVQAILEGGADALVERALPTATALTELLERARSAIVRGAPSDALAALDEGWDGAVRTESGWYYRGAALTLLGLPGEADRVLQQGLVRRGGSIALHFLTSIVRAMQGDSAGARDALAQAQARRPGDNVLVAWQSVLLARQGDPAGALRLLDPLLDAEPNSSVLSWARQAISAASTESTRASLAAQRRADVPAGRVDPSPELDWAFAETDARAPLADALRRLGARFVGTTAVDARLEVRLLLQALAAGGALDRAARPDQSVATRSTLVAMLGVLARESTESTPVRETPLTARVPAPAPGAALEAQPDAAGRWRLTPAMSVPAQADELASRSAAGARNAVLTALRAGAVSSAMAWLPRVASVEGEASAVVLRHLLTGAHERPATSAPMPAAPREAAVADPDASGAAEAEGTATRAETRRATPSAAAPPVVTPSARTPGRVDDALAVPIRIGLSLLQQSSAREEARSAVGVSTTREGAVDTWADSGSDLGAPQYAVAVPAPPTADSRAALIAAAAAAVAPVRAADGGAGAEESGNALVVTARNAGLRLRLLALVCMALAFGALMLGHGAVAIAFAGGASWLALRSSAVGSAARRQEREQWGLRESAASVTDDAPPVTLHDTPR